MTKNQIKNLIKPINLILAFHAIIIVLSIVLLMRNAEDQPSRRHKMVVIPIEGVISMEPGSMRHGLTVPSLLKTFQKIQDDKDIKAVILRINSPGGTVGAVQELYRALQKLKSEGKTIVSSFQEVSASGGYYIACAGDWITLNPGTLTGSIGVIMQLPNVQGLFRKIGMNMETIKSGDFKDSGSPFRKMSSQERRYFKDLILNSYQQFYAAVQTGRKLDDKALKNVANGRIFTGEMAVKHKLADQLGGLDEAIEKAKELAGIPDKKPQIIHHKGRRSIDRLFQMLTEGPANPLAAFTHPEIKLMYLMQ